MDEIVKEIVKTYWKELSKKKNVRYFSGTLKPRIKNGISLKEDVCFRVYVIEKDKTISPMSKDFVPRILEINGNNVGLNIKEMNISTDIIPIGLITALNNNRCNKTNSLTKSKSKRKSKSREENKYRPVKAGYSAMNHLGSACTLGWFAKNKKVGEEEFIGIIANNHCCARENKAELGEAYLCPSPYDGGTIKDKIASHWRHVDIKFNEYTCPYRNLLFSIRKMIYLKEESNEVDLGLEKIDIPMNQILFEIDVIGKVKGKRRGEIGELVKKCGRTTGYTEGAKLIDNDWYGSIQYSRGMAFFGPCTLYEGTKFSAGGDSSSAIVLMKDNYLTSILFAGSETHTIGVHYDLGEKNLEVELIVSEDN